MVKIIWAAGFLRTLARKDILWKASLGLVVAVVLFAAAWGSADNTIRLVRMDPEGEVPTRTNLNFFFSADVVPKSLVGKFTVTDKIKFRPAVPGKIRWETPRRLRYFPETAFKPSTAYTVEFAPDLPAGVKKNLAGERRLSFTTERFRVNEDARLDFVYDPERRRGLICQARLGFNYQVAADALQRALRLCSTDNRQAIRFTIQLTKTGREAVITSELLQRGRTPRQIELSLPEGFQCLGGSIGLRERFVRTAEFHERRALVVNDVEASSEAGLNAVVIRCSEPVDPEAAGDYITLKPAAKIRLRVDGETIALAGEGLKPGRTYEVILAKGLPALNGNPLERDYADAVTFPDLEPSITFDSPGRYLSSKGHLNLGLETANISQVEVEFAKIYANNLVSFLNCLNAEGRCYSYELARLGRVIETRKFNVANVENEYVTTPINLRDYLSDKRRGVFQVAARDPENRWRDAAKVVIVTDLGILAKLGRDSLVVWVNSLDDLSPKPGVRVSLVSYNNQEIAAGFTDGEGVARFTGLRQQLLDFRPYLILAETDDDLSFVSLGDSLIGTADFPVEGRPYLASGYEAFLYTDRGVFRPGEEANLAAVVRGPDASVPPEFPVRLEVVGPDGMVFRAYAGSTREAGLCQFQLPLPDYARTGRYTALLYAAEEVIGSTYFNVEEFMPDRIKVETSLDKESYAAGGRAVLKVRGVNLFGPPAAGRRVDAAVRLEPAPFDAPAYRSYTFGDPDRQFRLVEEVVGQGELDTAGQAEFAYDFPDNLTPPGAMRAIFQVTVTEDGGRAVSSVKAAEYHPYQAYIGWRRAGDYYAKAKEEYPLRLVEVDRAGKPFAGAVLDVEVYLVTWNSIYRRDEHGRYTYHCEREEKRIDKAAVQLAEGEGSYAYTPPDWGCYRIVFNDRKTGARAACEFYATGWGYAPWAMDHPDRLGLDLDKTVYKPGETATIQIKAPFPGRALVTVERDRVCETAVVELKENTGIITLPVKPEYGPNVYVSVHLIRTIKNLDKRAPTRAFGAVPLVVDCAAHRMRVEIAAAEEYRPNQTVEVQVRAGGGTGETYLTLAAVDEGILQLTEFETPDPLGFFYGKRALGLSTHDLYGMLLPEVEPVKSADSPAGDADAEGVRRRNLNPVAIRRVKPVSLWSGLLKLDTSGTARVKLALPQFNGTLRLMAVAVSGPDFGAAAKKVLVRDPIVMTATFPRFLAPGDRAVVPVAVYNGTGREGTFTVKLDEAGPVTIDGYDQKELVVADKVEKVCRFAIVAKQEAGGCRFTLVTAGNGARTTETTELAVRPAQPVTSKAAAGFVSAKAPVTFNLGAAWLSGTGEHVLCLAPLPALKYEGSLRYLLGYPHGCLEQTTSKLFPLLYFPDLARAAAPELFAARGTDAYVNEGIEKIQSMQVRSGGFSFWPGTDWSSDWGSIYAAHFLVEARRAGFTIADRVYDRMLGYLAKLGRGRTENDWDLYRRVYALYVLSLAGKPQTGSMAYLKSQRLGDLFGDGRAFLAAAYYYAGDKKTARELLPATFAASALKRERGGTFYSAIRADAIVLGVLADLDPGHQAVPKLVGSLAAEAKAERWYTTQENAFAFLALGKIYRQKQGAYTGEVLVNGKRLAVFDSKSLKRIADARLGNGKITIEIGGTGECYYYAESSGVPAAAVPTADNGLAVRREYLDRNGGRVELNHLKQGDLLIAKITVKTQGENLDNIAIVDMLPAGLEVENPRLSTSARAAWMGGDTFAPQYMDIRDDRVVFFASFGDAGTRCFYYAVRAVSCGTFVLPPIKAECMYEPEIKSVASDGVVEVEK